MDVQSGVLIVVYVVLVALCGTGIWVLVVVAGTARSVGRLADDLDEKLPPLIDRASETLDSVNSEVARVDGLVAQLEEVSDKVTSTTRAASELVNAPAAAVSGLGAKARRLFSVLTGRRL